MSIETLRDRIDYLEEEWAKEKAENAELKANWQELLLFAQEHYAGRFLYVEASEFINKMKALEATK